MDFAHVFSFGLLETQASAALVELLLKLLDLLLLHLECSALFVLLLQCLIGLQLCLLALLYLSVQMETVVLLNRWLNHLRHWHWVKELR